MAKKQVQLGPASQIVEGRACIFKVDGLSVAVCRVGASIYAVENLCTHDDGPLGEGPLDGFAIECPRHGARFDVRDGRVLRMPAAFPVRTFPAREEKGQILLEVDE